MSHGASSTSIADKLRMRANRSALAFSKHANPTHIEKNEDSKSQSRVKVFKEHMPLENQSIASSYAILASN